MSNEAAWGIWIGIAILMIFPGTMIVTMEFSHNKKLVKWWFIGVALWIGPPAIQAYLRVLAS